MIRENTLVAVLSVVVFIAIAAAVEVRGCSYADGALFPTEYDYIKEAQAIVLVEPTIRRDLEVDFSVLEVLKGNFTDQTASGFEANNSCTSISFQLDNKNDLPPAIAKRVPKITPKYLLFLERTDDNKWIQSSEATEAFNIPFVEPNTSSRLAAIRQLIRVSLLNDYGAEKRELNKLRKLAQSGRMPAPVSDELSKMIDDHLNTPTPNKSYVDLIEVFNRSEKETKRDALWALAKGNHPEAAVFFTRLLDAGIPPKYIGPVSVYVAQTKNEPLMVRLGKNYPALDEGVRWPIITAMILTADERHIDLMMAAHRSANQEEASRLAAWFLRFPNTEATKIVRSTVAGKYQKNWDLSFVLAGMGDEDIIFWAKDFMNSPDNDRWKALYIIAKSPLDEADKEARRVILKNSADDLTTLFQGYEESNNPNRYDRLRDIIDLKNNDSEVMQNLKTTLVNMKIRGDRRAAELLASIVE